ncbi:hypothetical protein F862_gp099 [Vibrio phage vB_VpaS_MAR10]|uniref:Uncharacterized protein n=1 Tax=Vibrio phage vB_VpaS_MAR10 TaxID=1229755 RepID=K7R6L0_9CAUD|nr:hypothetical protein F862_gp099 [Vibrio phage vB_VpaS_MAR10]AFV81331.1 hypothetical protein MAR10_096 [Vibrio phage vB_VpaS_MAR10]
MTNSTKALTDRGYRPAGEFNPAIHKKVSKCDLGGVVCRVVTGPGLERGIMPYYTTRMIGGFPVPVENKTFFVK